jgi:hypothetical protein
MHPQKNCLPVQRSLSSPATSLPGKEQELCQPQPLNHHLGNSRGKKEQLGSEHVAELFSANQQTYFGNGKS